MRSTLLPLLPVLTALSLTFGGHGCTRKSGTPEEGASPRTMAPATTPSHATARPRLRPEVNEGQRRAPSHEARRPPAVAGPSTPAADQKHVVAGATAFALDLYARLRTRKGNVFLSPWSITTALGMTYAGAKGITAREMAKALHFSLPQSRLHPALGAVQSLLKPGKGDVLAVANRIYPQSGLALLPPFVRTLKSSYGTTVQPLDFKTRFEPARKTINAWVLHRTQKRIRNLLHRGDLDQTTRMVLVNAIYFKGSWAHAFDKSATHPAAFQRAQGKTVKVPMMHQTRRFGYGALGDTAILELPYKGSRLAMVVLLPKRPDGLTRLEKTLTPQKLTRALATLRPRKVSVYLPRFKLTARFQLKKQLQALGVRAAFTDRANFRGIATQELLKISKVIHQATCDVAEEGTVAAAATAVIMARVGGRPAAPPEFRADHPFLILIRDRKTGAILFLGRLADPTK